MTDFNKNMLSPAGFTFSIKKLPEFNFFVQSVSLPGISLPMIDQPTPFKTIPVPGDHITYGDISVTFKINEDLGNYIEIFNWIRDMGFPEDYSQYRRIASQPQGDGIYSDATLTILSSAMNPVMFIEIHDVFPVSLTSIEMNSRDTTIDYIESTVDFKFKNYYFVPA
jgi:hypothetical protein